MKKEISLAPSLVFVLQRRWEQCNGRDGDSDDNRDDNEDSVNDDDNDDSSVYVLVMIYCRYMKLEIIWNENFYFNSFKILLLVYLRTTK